jgi:hypothetical protein
MDFTNRLFQPAPVTVNMHLERIPLKLHRHMRESLTDYHRWMKTIARIITGGSYLRQIVPTFYYIISLSSSQLVDMFQRVYILQINTPFICKPCAAFMNLWYSKLKFC